MEIRVVEGVPGQFEAEVLVVPVAKGDAPSGTAATVDAALGGHLAEAMARGEFKAAPAQAIAFPAPDLASRRVLFVGVGDAEKVSAETLRRLAGKAARALNQGKFTNAAIAPLSDDAPFGGVEPSLAGEALAEGLILGSYRFTEYKTGDDDQAPDTLTRVAILSSDEAAAEGTRYGQVVSAGTYLAMDMANHPSAVVTPQRLADEASALAAEYGMTLTVLDEDRMREMGMGGMIGVGQGSEEPSQFIILEHKGSEDAPVVLVGKSITFDTGGISIKPSAGMEEMKGDMSGGAAVLGTMRAVGQLNLPIHVTAILTAAENMPSGTAQNPGDILHMYNGLTVEVINTDAEGRLVLADGLAYADKELKPRCMVDIATLTGACVVALGHHAVGMLGTDPDSMALFREVGDDVEERVWELPLWDEYNDSIKSNIADIKNTGGRAGGTITAGCFLKKFTGDTPWVHLDIAATAWDSQHPDYLPKKGATGVGVRLMTGFLRRLSAG